jgi:hypothetical protein
MRLQCHALDIGPEEAEEKQLQNWRLELAGNHTYSCLFIC